MFIPEAMCTRPLPVRLTTVSVVSASAYESGKDWVACACGRWLNIEDCITDSDGNEHLCFVCLNNYSTDFLALYVSHSHSHSCKSWHLVNNSGKFAFTFRK